MNTGNLLLDEMTKMNERLLELNGNIKRLEEKLSQIEENTKNA